MSMEIGQYSTRSNMSNTRRNEEDDEEALMWAALERLPTYDRARKGVLHGVLGDLKEIDLRKLGLQDRKELLNRFIKSADKHEEYLKKLKERMDRVSLDLPTIEVRFENINVQGEAYVGSRALPTISNSIFNAIEGVGHRLHILSTRKKKFSILRDVSGIIKPGRLTLLLGPPGSGKTTLLQALTGKLDPGVKFAGKVTYNGHEMHEFVPQRTSAYISQYDVHIPQLTVRETLEFSAKCQGVGTGYDMLTELLRREKELNIRPDPYIDALMKASVLKGHKEKIVTDYVLKILGLEVCADTIVGDAMRRGVSGGQKKRVTTGEMLVGPVGALFMDNISTGLDSSTTYQIVNSIKQSIHIFNKTAIISLLQPPPETFELFDDIILLSEGRIVYQGPREYVLPFFESMGFKCPDRKGIADYLQEVTSRKDQGQYWFHQESPYRFISVDEFSEAFKSFHTGLDIQHQLDIPFDRSKNHPAALTKTRYGANKKELMKACLSREFILLKRNLFLHAFKIFQLEISAVILATVFVQARKHHSTIEDGTVYLGALFFALNTITFTGFFELPLTIDKLPIFYKQRDRMFYPSWAFSLPTAVLGISISVFEVAIWVAITYYVIGFDPNITRMLKQYLILVTSGQMSYSLFRCIAALARDHIVANTAGCLAVMWLLMFSGFILSRENMHTWLIWGYWTSPLMYVQTAISVNEFLGQAWNRALNGTNETLGVAVLRARGVFTSPDWYWIGVVAMVGFILIFNGVSALAFAYLDEYGKSQAVFLSEESAEEDNVRTDEGDGTLLNKTNSKTKKASRNAVAVHSYQEKGVLLPFVPHTVTFDNITYSVDMPTGMKVQGVLDDRLILLNGVSGAFRPGVLTALMGVSGAGKTTLLDVLAGRKNSGYIEGNITVSGYAKKQETFARVTGYCEQNDIHSPLVTVHESLLYSAWLRLPPEVDPESRELFVEEVMELVELKPLRDALVGFPNVNGLSIEQRKRLTIAVELVANPSIIFMDEPTSGLDARAAAIVMRTVRNTVDTGRTVVCTIHQPSIDIFESFDELFLLTRGGEEIYFGPVGRMSSHLINYFEGINGVSKIKEGYNPATWVLEVTTRAQEEILGVKFAVEYKKSDLYRKNKALISELSIPPPGSQDLYFPTKYAQSYFTQFKACLWKQHKSYWRNIPYNAVRLYFCATVSIMFGVLFWNLGSKRRTKQDVFNAMGAMYTAISFMGAQSAASVRPVIIAERTVVYRERAAGMYSALPYAFAQVAIEIPYTIAQVAIYGIVVYAMMGFQWTASKFFLNTFFMFITVLLYIYYGIMVVSASPNQAAAAVLSGVFYTTWNLFSGFIIPRPRIIKWWRWYAWLCPVSWSLWGMSSSQYGDLQSKLDTGETVAQFLVDYFGFRHDWLWLVSVVLIGFTLTFASVFAFSMKFLNFQKR
ncbi:ATP-binding cassette G38, pleiotropic drug resistance 10 [Hibiscus trionum]|uniref:ATP-binding cassette G38, pleiotropic drug resistance 10 n=1 Tax=Hibiscus trionum TaxID=183268 RepID=A0A9W7I5Y7_HIBTR|nr:ATP-binding cassette G38, pleiotropic drug resistance 10 [Hibiscus trionum]